MLGAISRRQALRHKVRQRMIFSHPLARGIFGLRARAGGPIKTVQKSRGFSAGKLIFTRYLSSKIALTAPISRMTFGLLELNSAVQKSKSRRSSRNWQRTGPRSRKQVVKEQ